MKALLNAKIKRRESFRPFAPSVLEEAVADWFEENDTVPFMMQVFQIREDKKNQIGLFLREPAFNQILCLNAKPQNFRAAYRPMTSFLFKAKLAIAAIKGRPPPSCRWPSSLTP